MLRMRRGWQLLPKSWGNNFLACPCRLKWGGQSHHKWSRVNELACDWILAGASGQQGSYTFCLLVGVSGVTAGKAFELAEA